VPLGSARLWFISLMRNSLWLQVRYVKVASQNPELVLPVMKMFLRGSGLSHPHEAHATRACYLFMRIVKVLRPQLQEHLEELIQGLIPVVMQIVRNPIQIASHALKATVARGAHTQSHTGPVKFPAPAAQGTKYINIENHSNTYILSAAL
jgi:hypothetical protein